MSPRKAARINRTNPEVAGAVVESLCAGLGAPIRRRVLQFLAESIREAAEADNERWAVTLEPGYVRFNVGQTESVVLRSDAVSVLILGGGRIPGTTLSRSYPSAGGSRLLQIPHELVVRVLPAVEALHLEAKALARRRPCTSVVKGAHSPGVVEYLWAELKLAGQPPVPTHYRQRRKERAQGSASPAETSSVGGTTYLFSWNPKRWEWTDLEAALGAVARDGFVDERWSCGNRRQLEVGSPAVLIRLGPEKPTGIVGLGVTRSAPFEAQHYSVPGKRAWYVDVRWHALRREPVIEWQELQRPPFAGFRWGIEGSGVELPAALAQAVRSTWASRAGSQLPLLADEVTPQMKYVEGSVKTITVNAYERDEGARAACLAHYGFVCAVCDVRLEDRYGEIARAFIHVHHLVPVSTIGESYEVNPVRDLRPVCPNCHAILHRRNPPLTVEEGRRLVRR